MEWLPQWILDFAEVVAVMESLIGVVIAVFSIIGYWIGGWRESRRIRSTPAITHTVNYSVADSDSNSALLKAAQSKTYRRIKDVEKRLPRHLLGDGASYVELPVGTRIVTLKDDSMRLAIPIDVNLSFKISAEKLAIALNDRNEKE